MSNGRSRRIFFNGSSAFTRFYYWIFFGARQSSSFSSNNAQRLSGQSRVKPTRRSLRYTFLDQRSFHDSWPTFVRSYIYDSSKFNTGECWCLHTY